METETEKRLELMFKPLKQLCKIGSRVLNETFQPRLRRREYMVHCHALIVRIAYTSNMAAWFSTSQLLQLRM